MAATNGQPNQIKKKFYGISKYSERLINLYISNIHLNYWVMPLIFFSYLQTPTI